MTSLYVRWMLCRSRRSWWQAAYYGGKRLSEWDTVLGVSLPRNSVGGTSRWEDVPKAGMTGLRLFCPNGQCAVLEAPEGHRFFQLKIGRAVLGVGLQRFCDAHLIGVVTDGSGQCECYAWNTATQCIDHFWDNVRDLRYGGVGPLNLDVQGVRF